ncbi:MAG: Gfo/Idh/MocA family oxidoreductase [Bacteroidales bacterium]|jgi:predicted dehydrogenase|nr:Gfo/Idh/MocA family oxidoreductase [Bacteroidales bacterium]
MLRTAILGTGDISHEFVQNVAKASDFRITHVYNRDIAKAAAFARSYNIEHSCDTYATVNASDVDVVYIGLPNGLHFEAAREALTAGKHVLVEKPLVSTLHEFDVLSATAARAGCRLIEITRTLSSSGFSALRNCLPQLGALRWVDISFCKYSRKYNAWLEGQKPNVFTAEFSGGALYDLGVYGVHLAVGLFGLPRMVSYRCNMMSSGVDSAGALCLTYDGFTVNMLCGKNFELPPRVALCGERDTAFSASPPSILHNVRLLKNAQQLTGGGQSESDNFLLTLLEAVHLLRPDATAEYEARLRHCRNVIQVLCAARADAGIVFPADLFCSCPDTCPK